VPARRDENQEDRLKRIGRLVHTLEDELAALREEGRVVSQSLANDSAKRAKRAVAAGRAAVEAKRRAGKLGVDTAERVRRRNR
jgi:hypothetical protein